MAKMSKNSRSSASSFDELHHSPLGMRAGFLSLFVVSIGLFGEIAAGARASTAASGVGAEILAPGQPLRSVALSPGGRRVAYGSRSEDGVLWMHVVDLATWALNRFEIGRDLAADRYVLDADRLRPAQLLYVEWATEQRLVFTQLFGSFEAADADGSNRVRLLEPKVTRHDRVYGSYRVHNLMPWEPSVILVEASISLFEGGAASGGGRVMSPDGQFNFGGMGSQYDYYLVDIHTGLGRGLLGASGSYRGLLVDRLGNLRASLDSNASSSWNQVLISTDGGKPKVPLSDVLGRDLVEQYKLRHHDVKDAFRGAVVHGFGYNPDILFFESNTGRDTYALYAADLGSKTVSGPLVESERFDVYGSLVYFDAGQRLAGIRYEDTHERTHWLLPELAEAQRSADEMLPGRVNRIVDMSDDLERFLVVSRSDRDPGTVVVVERGKTSPIAVTRLNEHVDPTRMARTIHAWVKTRDEREVLCYITLPPTARPGVPAPTVVLLHGGPWARDSWGFDSEVQYLAAHGYVVLQVNFRGSEGFGFRHLQAAWRRFGDSALEDVEDVIRWAKQGRLVDPERLVAMGTSYGGYLSLYLQARNPDLFAGSVSIAGVTDLLALVHDADASSNWDRGVLARVLIGDPRKDKDTMRKASPLHLAERLVKPVLLVHGTEDRVVPIEHSERLRRRLAGLKREVEYLEVKDAWHGGWTGAEERRILEAVVAFIERCSTPTR